MRPGTRHATRSAAKCVLVAGVGAAVAVAALPGDAGTTVINVATEGAGDIQRQTGEINTLGAMVWNGTMWVVNGTYAHKYFVDTRTGDRLKSYTAHDSAVSGAPDAGTLAAACAIAGSGFAATGYGNLYAADGFQGYTITRQAYTYAKPAAYGTYCYGAVEYVIQDPGTGLAVVLRSRGVGGGTGQAYFDVYIEDQLLPSGTQTTAFRGDPAWFTYPGLTAQQAKLVADTTANRTGDLPGAVTTQGSNVGDYYLDIGGGADLGPAGVGKSYELHTGPVGSAFNALSPAYVTSFEYKWMDGSGNLQKITVSPTLWKEVYVAAPPVLGAQSIPLLPWPWLAPLAASLAALAAWGIRRRR